MCPCKHLLFYFMVLLWLWQILFASALSFQIWFIKWLTICLPSISLHISIFRINFIKGSKNTLQIKRIWERNRFHFWCYLRFSFNLHKGFMHLILPNLSNKCYWTTDLRACMYAVTESEGQRLCQWEDSLGFATLSLADWIFRGHRRASASLGLEQWKGYAFLIIVCLKKERELNVGSPEIV